MSSTQSTLSWLDRFFTEREVQDHGTALPLRPKVDFAGAGVTAADDPANERTIVTINAAPPPPGADKEILFNDGGAVGASAGLTFDKTVGGLNIGVGGFLSCVGGSLVLGSDPALTGHLATSVQIFPSTIVYLGAGNSTGFAVDGASATAYAGVLKLRNGGCANSGHLRAPNATRVVAFLGVDTVTDRVLFETDASDQIWIGVAAGGAGNPAQNVYVLPAGATYIGGGGNAALSASGAGTALMNGLPFKTAPSGTAASGVLRLKNAEAARFLAADGVTDLPLFETDASDAVYIGTDAAFAMAQPSLVRVAGGAIILGRGTARAVSVRSEDAVETVAVGARIVGDTAMSSPFGVHGEVTIDMANADYTATANDFKHGIITNGSATPMTAARSLLLPATTDEGAYFKFVRNANGAGFPVAVFGLPGFAGTSVTVADGFGAWVGVHAAGAFRMSPDIAP